MAAPFRRAPRKLLWCGLVVVAVALVGFPLWFSFGASLGALFSEPRDEPPLVRTFHDNRAEIGAFVDRYRAAEKGATVLCPECLRIEGWGFQGARYPRVTTESDCVVLDWFWGPPQSFDEYLIHSPRGLLGLPPNFRRAAVEARIRQLDENWFYMTEP